MAISLDLRQRVINASKEKKKGEPLPTQMELSLRFSVDQSTVSRWLRRYAETGAVERKPVPGRPPKLGADDELFLKEKLTEKSDLTLQEMVVLLKDCRGIIVTHTPIQRVLKRLRYSRKKRVFMTQPKN